MKKILTLIAIVALMAVPAFAATYTSGAPADFDLTASVPAATGISITATQVNADTDKWGSAVTEMNFNTAGKLKYDEDNGIWVSNQYFAVDVGLIGGGGNLSTVVKYVEGAKPTGQTKGLDYKATAKFVKVTGVAPDQDETNLAAGQKLLAQLIGAGQTIASSETAGGFLRIYVGLYTGDNAALNTAGGEPFTNSDKSGTYNGTLTVTGTIL